MAAQRILVIEDEPGAREALESLLAEEGYTVASAESGETGLRRLSEFHPDTVVCDFYLPDTDGLQILRKVRSQSGGQVTFIVITAGCGGDGVERTLQREADYFFQKPVDLQRLRSALEREIGHAPAVRAVAAANGHHLPAHAPAVTGGAP